MFHARQLLNCLAFFGGKDDFGRDDSKAFISGCSGVRLSSEEKRFFARERPCGLILFRRNCETPEQIRALTDDFRDSAGRRNRALVLIDQEGGRVQRLAPPNWRRYPPARVFGLLYERDPEKGLPPPVSAPDSWPRTCTPWASPWIARRCSTCPSPAPTTSSATGPSPLRPDASRRPGRAVSGGTDWTEACCRSSSTSRDTAAPRRTAMFRCRSSRRPWRTCDRVDFKPFAELASMPLAMTAHVLIPELDADRPASASPAHHPGDDPRVASALTAC